jgi:hypothetical protein
MRAALTDLVGAQHETARPEGFVVDGFDFGVMRRSFRQVFHVGKAHGLCVPVDGERFAANGSVRQSALHQARAPFRRRSNRIKAKSNMRIFR